MLLARFILVLIGVASAGDARAFYANGQWLATATDNPSQPLGLPATLTWSIVPDGTTLLNVVGNQSRTSDLVGWLDAMFNESGQNSLDQRAWFPYLQQSFNRWSEVSGVQLVYEPHDDGLDHGGNPGVLGVRGDLRLGGTNIDGNGGTYGQAGFVPNADLMLDTGDQTRFSNPTQDYFYLRNTLTHEIGHSLGLGHTESFNSHVLMTPFALEEELYDGPQHDDIRGIHYLYGDKFERGSPGGNNSFAAASPLGELDWGATINLGEDAPTTTTISPEQNDFLSITSAANDDYFAFSLTRAASLQLTVTPLGRTYSERQNSFDSFSTTNASRQSDLSLELYYESPTGAVLLASSNSGGLGAAEVLDGFLATTAGDYYVRVAGSTSNVQLYGLAMDVLAPVTTPGDYNADGVVDAGDYAVWRNSLGVETQLPNEADSPGVVDLLDYEVWRAAYGSSAAIGAASPAPEPFGLGQLAWLLGMGLTRLRRAAAGNSLR